MLEADHFTFWEGTYGCSKRQTFSRNTTKIIPNTSQKRFFISSLRKRKYFSMKCGLLNIRANSEANYFFTPKDSKKLFSSVIYVIYFSSFQPPTPNVKYSALIPFTRYMYVLKLLFAEYNNTNRCLSLSDYF